MNPKRQQRIRNLTAQVADLGKGVVELAKAGGGNPNHDERGRFSSGGGSSGGVSSEDKRRDQKQGVVETAKLLSGFKQYQHGRGSDGFLDANENKVTVADLDKHFKSLGYDVAHSRTGGGPIVGMSMHGGYKMWAYEKGAGPYQDYHISIDSKGGKYARDVHFQHIRATD